MQQQKCTANIKIENKMRYSSKTEAAKYFKDYFARAKNNPEYYAELLKLEVTEEIFRSMERENISKSELARRFNCSPAYITKILNGSANLTIDTLSSIAFVLGMKWHCITVPIDGDVSYEWNIDKHTHSFGGDDGYRDIKYPTIRIYQEEYQKSA